MSGELALAASCAMCLLSQGCTGPSHCSEIEPDITTYHNDSEITAGSELWLEIGSQGAYMFPLTVCGYGVRDQSDEGYLHVELILVSDMLFERQIWNREHPIQLTSCGFTDSVIHMILPEPYSDVPEVLDGEMARLSVRVDEPADILIEESTSVVLRVPQ